MRVLMSDIRQRAYFLSESTNNVISRNEQITNLYMRSIENKRPNDIFYCINNYDKLPGKTNDDKFVLSLNLLEALSYYGTPGEITKAGLLLEKKALKVKNTKQMGDTVKNSLKGLKNKSTRKKKKSSKDLEKSVTVKTTDTNGKPIATGKNPPVQQAQPVKAPAENPEATNEVPTEANENALIDSYQSIEEALHKITHIDRILENYEKISSRFNIEKVLEQKTIRESTYDAVMELCELIDTYNIPDIIKYNSVIESAWYAYNRLGIDVDRSIILASATDYFLLKDKLLDECRYVLESSVLYTDKEKSRVRYVLEDDIEDDNSETIDENTIDYIIDEYAYYVTEEEKKKNFIQKTIELPKKIISKIPKKDVSTERYVDDKEAEKIINDYKKKIHDPNAENNLINVVNKIFVNYNAIVTDMPSFFDFLRALVCVGSFAINPILGAVAALANLATAMHLRTVETKKMRDAFIEEKHKVDSKARNAKSDKERERLEKYSEQLQYSIEKITDYQDQYLLTRDGQDKREKEDDEKAEKRELKDAKKMNKNSSGNDDDFNFDFDFESAKLALSLFSNINENMDLVSIISDNIHLLSKNNILSEICKFSKLYPNIINPYELKTIIEWYSKKINNGSIILESLIDKCIIIDENAKSKSILESNIKSIEKEYTFKESCNTLYNFYNIYSGFRMLSEANNQDPNNVQQDQPKNQPQQNTTTDNNQQQPESTALSFKNTFSIALDKIRKGFSNLSGQEKQISQEFDATVDGMVQNSYKAMMNNNREAILKGSILPSASKTLKIVLASGLGFLVNPWLGIIPILSYIATNKLCSHKEKVAILDEIEIELEMTNKRLSIAEGENDLSAQKELLKIQRELLRQQSQIKKGLLKDNKFKPDPDVSAVSGGN